MILCALIISWDIVIAPCRLYRKPIISKTDIRKLKKKKHKKTSGFFNINEEASRYETKEAT